MCMWRLRCVSGYPACDEVDVGNGILLKYKGTIRVLEFWIVSQCGMKRQLKDLTTLNRNDSTI